jgi:hypothetical protein
LAGGGILAVATTYLLQLSLIVILGIGAFDFPACIII